MGNLKDHTKRGIKFSYAYQIKKSRDYFIDRRYMFQKLQSDETSDKYRTAFLKGSKEKQLIYMMKKTNITIIPGKRFQSWIDTGLYVMHFYDIIDNMAPNYEIILAHSVEEMIQLYEADIDEYSRRMCVFLRGIKEYIQIIIEEIDRCLLSCKDNLAHRQLMKTKAYFQNMLTKSVEDLEEGFQRILFWSTLFWQSQHRLVGLGRLDKILAGLKLPNDQDTVDLIVDFYKELHRYFAFKSNGCMLGDTGQIIELGGIGANGKYFWTRLTYLFIYALKSCMLPDPKILLRVSSKMPDDLLELALQCIATGIGCPLLSNDDVIVPALEQFGYSHYDACDYITSACWEPLSYGRSLEQNNIKSINYAEALVSTYTDDTFEFCPDFEKVLSLYLDKLAKQVEGMLTRLGILKWEPDPLASLFTESCTVLKRDISEGGAKYSNYGLLGTGMANAVNSLLNIKHFVFQEKCYSLKEMKEACISNFGRRYSGLQRDMQGQEYFGRDDEEAIWITKRISDKVYNICKGWKNSFGGTLKWGLSAPAYVESGKSTEATLDGRNKGMPLASHISCRSAYTELVNFACRLDYAGQKSNGNVIDFFVAPEYILNNFQKFMKFIKISIEKGFFQMQMNVVSSKELIAAKERPELFPELIVRVWGFSAYFNDLPEEYKDILINRAVESEQRI